MQIVMAFLMLTMMSIMLPRAGVAADRIDEVIRTHSSIEDPAEPKQITEPKGVLEFTDVCFKYPNAKEDVLHNISFKAEPGFYRILVLTKRNLITLLRNGYPTEKTYKLHGSAGTYRIYHRREFFSPVQLQAICASGQRMRQMSRSGSSGDCAGNRVY